jgi:50S ribosomal protein L4/50S ribosomal protein uL3
VVTQVRTQERDGYQAIQLAYAEARKGKVTKPLAGHFKAADARPARHLVELRTETADYSLGQEIKADIFQPGDQADVVGVSKGKGFAGTMKRHGFGGLGASHGTERKHRSPGAIGACATPSRVFKGTRMAGQMGNERVTVLNLEVVEGGTGPDRLPCDGSLQRQDRRDQRKAALMASIQVRDPAGKVLRDRDLPAEFFEAPVNVPAMHQVVVAGLAAQRAGTHSTKTRGEVSGGGRKPWRQKGTGRARQGSIRAPHWMGGGVSHGPQPRDHSIRVNRKMRRVALRSALTDALQSGKLAIVEGLSFDGPRTKDAVGMLSALELDGRVLLVIAEPDEFVEKSFRNLGSVKIDYPGNLSTYDVLAADRVLFTAEALDALAGVRAAAPAVAAEPASDTAADEEAES